MELMLMPSAGFLAASIILFLIGFLGFFGNLIVIIIMCRDKNLWTPVNFILFNVIVSDFSVAALGNPFTLASAIAKRWFFGQSMCVAYGFFMALLGITSINSLTVLALERYLIVSQPVSHGSLSRPTALTIVGSIWLYSFVITAPPLVGWGEYGLEAANISCSINWETRSHSSTSYILFLFTFGFFIPIIVISYSYMNIILTMKKSTMNAGRVNKAESRVTWMIFVMIFAFFLAWTPYAILALMIAFFDSNVSPAIATIPAIFAKTSICYNPFIYAGLNTQFRQSWRRVLGGKREDSTTMATATSFGLNSKRYKEVSCVIDVKGKDKIKLSALNKSTATETAI
ncbi:parapinopsin-like [Rhodnius prolixus]|uniref:G-protein coupled receptors family 1 profile domain-containing protein n=1 Tax=Rhodnius prolixus TaxID=13249 RepID=A0A0H2UI65_RHOPR